MIGRLVLCLIIATGAVASEPTAKARKLAADNKMPASVRVADAARPDGVRLTTTWPSPIMNQGDTIVNTLDVYNAIAGQKIRIQNSNHGAGYFTTNFSAAVQAALAAVPGVTYTQINAQQMEITLAAGTYK